jgi:hypothetical protein
MTFVTNDQKKTLYKMLTEAIEVINVPRLGNRLQYKKGWNDSVVAEKLSMPIGTVVRLRQKRFANLRPISTVPYDKQRALEIVLRDCDLSDPNRLRTKPGFSYKTVAKEIGCPESSVYTLMKKARGLLDSGTMQVPKDIVEECKELVSELTPDRAAYVEEFTEPPPVTPGEADDLAGLYEELVALRELVGGVRRRLADLSNMFQEIDAHA